MTRLQQHEHLFEHVNGSVMIRTMEGRIDSWNRGAEDLYGWSKEEAIGRVSHNLLQTQFPQPLEEIESEVVQNGRWEGRLVHTTQDGRRVVVESRWTVGLREQRGMLVEINTRSTDCLGREEPVRTSKLMKADDVLPKIANLILAGGGVVCLLAWFYVIYHYDWTGHRQFASRMGAILYHGLTAGSAALLLGALRLRSAYKINLALSVLSIGVSVYTAELLLGLFIPTRSGPGGTLWGSGHFNAETKREIAALAKKSGIEFDFRSRAEVVMDLRKQGVSAVPSLIPIGLLKRQADGTVRSEITVGGAEVLPVSGISNRVTVLCNETGEYTIYDSDEHGFHNPKGIWGSSRVAVAALGDSFTSGACVPSNKNFVALIRNQYPQTLNLGMLGEGPLIMLAALKEYLPFVKPKVVLWFFYEENDIHDLHTESASLLLRSYLSKDNFTQALFNRQPDIDQVVTTYIEQAFKAELAKQREFTKQNKTEKSWQASATVEDFLKLGHLRQALGVVYGRDLRAPQKGEDPEYSETQLNLFRNVLLQAKETVNGWMGTLYFVYLPDRDRYANGTDYHRQSILSIVRGIDLPIIDIDASFQKQSDPLSLFPFGRFGHYNEEGNRVVAEEVLRRIAESVSTTETPSAATLHPNIKDNFHHGGLSAATPQPNTRNRRN